ncbi:MAG: dienelactone hydrolase family protein [Ignavibacteriaceae bacterium]|nr:dienelactone hydrolase family protein [Ignavibacteriaceae bacterium]
MEINEHAKIKSLHQDQHMIHYGAVLDDADAAIIMVHGRGSSAHDIISLAYEVDLPNVAYIAPQAKNNSWYPLSFLNPVEMNEPGISSGMALLNSIVEMVLQKGFTTEQIYLLGFSQGACLSLEYAARNPKKFGGIFGLSGGLIGEAVKLENYSGDLEGTDIFLGCSDVDPHIPLQRVNDTEQVFKKLNANVSKRIFEGMAHTVNEDEIDFIKTLLKQKTAKQF